ncbi:unnamed protein product [Parnassius apollo]|uniref:(apollo) hypothetical protein n=1 Tax=Parnassius apollo TaxID=110799 RepID=A0A8S3X6J5_PARAO|nr:unnamed protein product [Parnassius apollo]
MEVRTRRKMLLVHVMPEARDEIPVHCTITLVEHNVPGCSRQTFSEEKAAQCDSWITPTQLSSECVLCTECLTLLQDQANTISEGLPAFGHRSICFTCGNSILRATRTHILYQDWKEFVLLAGDQLQENCNVVISTTPIALVCQKLFCLMLDQVAISIFLSRPLFQNKTYTLLMLDQIQQLGLLCISVTTWIMAVGAN